MLVSLSVRDVVIIKNVELNFKNGFSTLTGETGAGKSILMDALGLVLGKRSESRLIRKGQEKAIVIAEFKIPENHRIKSFLNDAGIVLSDEFILRRQLNSNGRSQSFLNDQIISLNLMKELGYMLVEIHGQNDKFGLLDDSTHLDVLDSWAGLKNRVGKVKKSFINLKDAIESLDKKIIYLKNLNDSKEIIEQDLKEINAVNIQVGEEDNLLEKKNILANSEKISTSIKQIMSNIEGQENQDSIRDRIELAKKYLLNIYHITGDNLLELKNALDRASIEINEVEVEIKKSHSLFNFNPDEQEMVENRLYLIKQLFRKHSLNNSKELEKLKEELSKKISLINKNSENIKSLSDKKKSCEEDYKNKVKELSIIRNKVAKDLDRAINFEFSPLKLDNAKFRVNLESLVEDNWGIAGADKAIFEIETNKGFGFDSLSKIASGGELSRIMLALKVSLQSSKERASHKRTLIFDEVDTGVGGAVADAVGQRLFELGKEQQVLAVTHLPQVAARASQHLKEDKINSKDTVKTIVTLLNENERREELARMLSGANITDAARKAALSLVESQR